MSHGLEVKKVIAMRKEWLEGGAFSSFRLLGVILVRLGNDGGVAVNGAQMLGSVEVFVESIGRMDRVEGLGSIFTLESRG